MAGTSDIALVSLHQRDAELDARERLADSIADAGGPDVLLLLTCHRAEALVAGPTDPRAIAERFGAELPEGCRVRTGQEAIRQLLRIACGLDSTIAGEAQILGQLRRAFDAARTATGLDPSLSLVARRAIELGRELRRTTALGSVRRTLGSLAVDAALDGLADPTAATVLVLGAGEIGTLALRALRPRVGSIIVVNRDADRASTVAAEHDAIALPVARIDAALAASAAVIAAADSRGTILTEERLRARLAAGPLAIVDLAVPRSVPAGARAIDGLRYVDVDGLATAAGSQVDAAVLGAAEGRCASAAAALCRELVARRAVPTITALRDRAETIRQQHLRRALNRLGHLPERDRRVIESLSLGIAHALMHEPTVRLREDPERERSARELFTL